MDTPSSLKATFPGHSGGQLAARLDIPAGPVRATALFAHCFTCSKDILAARRIATDLARAGILVMRFDFTGLGSSEGEFAHSNFSSNLEDLRLAAAWLAKHHGAPSLMIGHSLGGAAVLAVAGEIDSVKGVVTIAAPAHADHVIANFSADLDRIEKDGKAPVTLAGRSFTIEKQFIDDLRAQSVLDRVKAMKKPLLVLHGPLDQTVGIENATDIFLAARHPKSFVSLDKADHLLTREEDARYAATVISGWSDKYIGSDRPQGETPMEHVTVAETGGGKFQNVVHAGRHRLYADEPEKVGGMDTGPSPYDFLSMALGACTSMTLRMYIDHKKLDVGRIAVDVSHAKIHSNDCAECDDDTKASNTRIDRFERRISVEGGIPEGLEEKMLEIADKCPVHRTLERSSVIATKLED